MELESVDKSFFLDFKTPVIVLFSPEADGVIVDLFPVFWNKDGNKLN